MRKTDESSENSVIRSAWLDRNGWPADGNSSFARRRRGQRLKENSKWRKRTAELIRLRNQVATDV